MKRLYASLFIFMSRAVAMEKKPELLRSPSSPNLQIESKENNGIKRTVSSTGIVEYAKELIKARKNQKTGSIHTVITTTKGPQEVGHGNGFYLGLEQEFTKSPTLEKKSKKEKKHKKQTKAKQ